MKFVVTGGAGFIGSHISRKLVQAGHHVVIVDNLVRGTVDNFSDFQSKIDFEKIDILDLDAMESVTKDADGVFHQAALVSVPNSFQEPELYHKVNVTGTKNVFELAKKFDFKIVYASSSAVYGHQETFPINENAPKNPTNPYAQTKVDCEILAQQYVHQGVKIMGLRYFNVFGIGQNPAYAGVISVFIDQLMRKKPPVIEGDGGQTRSFIFVDDVADANILAMERSTDHTFINIGNGDSVSVLDLAKTLIRLAGLDMQPEYTEPRKGDVRLSVSDISLAKNALGWEPRTDLSDGLKQIFSKLARQ